MCADGNGYQRIDAVRGEEAVQGLGLVEARELRHRREATARRKCLVAEVTLGRHIVYAVVKKYLASILAAIVAFGGGLFGRHLISNVSGNKK